MMRSNLGILSAVTLAIAAALLVAPHATASEETIYTVEGDVQAPKRVAGEPPAYPENAREERREWLVVVRSIIDRDGKVELAEVLEGEHEEFVPAVRAALDTWRFEPATLRGEPVTVYYNLTFRFRLDGDRDG